MRLIDADARVTVNSFDEEHEEYDHTEMSVEEALDFATDEGCPPVIETTLTEQWISVKNALPEINQRVLVFGVGKYEDFIGTTQIAITFMSDDNLINRCYKSEPYWIAPWQYFLTDYEITHWMALPEGPKEED